MSGFFFLAIAVCASLGTNFALKAAVQGAETGSLLRLLTSLLALPSFWVGMVSGFVLLGSFMAAMRSLPISTAYPVLTASAIVLMTCIEWFAQGVSMPWLKLVGLACLILGVALVSSHGQ